MALMPNLDDIRKKITPRTKGLVVINPNKPKEHFILTMNVLWKWRVN